MRNLIWPRWPALPLVSFILILSLTVRGADARGTNDAPETSAALSDDGSAAARPARALMRKENWKAGADELDRLVKTQPGEASFWNDLGVCHLNLTNWPAAEKAFLQAIKVDPNYAKAHYNLGVLASQRDQPDQAIAHYRQALNLNPNYYDALYNLGTVLLQKGKLGEAEAAFQRLVSATRAARFHRAYYNLGLAKAQRKDFAGAIRCYRESLLLNQNHVPSYVNLASAYLDLDDYPQAEDTLKKAESLEPDNYKVAWNRALVKQKTTGDEAAVPFYEKTLKLKPDYAPAAFNLGLAEYRLKHYATAEQLFQKVLALQKDDAESNYMLGKIYSDQNLSDQAIAAYRKAVAQDPHHFAAWKNLGIWCAREKRYREAWEAMQKAIDLKPDDSDAVVYGAGYLIKLGRQEEASKLYQKAYASGATSPTLLRALGQQAAKAGKPDEAIGFYRHALEIEPTPETWYNLGLLYRRQQKWEEAGEAYQKALQLDPKFAKASLNLGYVHLHQNRFAEARRCFDLALKNEPGYDNALSALKELNAAEAAQAKPSNSGEPEKKP